MNPTTRRLRELRISWRYWRAPWKYGAPIDYCLICPTRCGECEACAMTAYRQDRLDAIKAEALTLAGTT